MFTHFWRRPVTAVVDVPAPSVMASSPLRLSKALREERRYWRTIVIQMVGTLAITVITLALIAALVWASTWFGGPRLDIPFALSPSSGAEALALLAAIIIALQVSVRGGVSGDDPNKALGRQFAIEGASRLTAFAAFTVVLGVWLADASFEPATLVRVILFLAAATFLAGIAADAAVASSFRYGAEISRLAQRDSFIRLRARLVWRLRTAPPDGTLPAQLIQVALILVVGNVVSSAVVTYIGFPDGTTDAWWQLFLILSAVSVTCLVLMAFAKSSAVSGDFVTSAYLWFMAILPLAGVTVFAISAVIIQGLPGLPQLIVALAFAVSLAVIQPALLTGRLPALRGGMTTSWVFTATTHCLAKKIGKADPRRREMARSRAHSGPSLSAITALVLAVILPPVGLALGAYIYRSPATSGVSLPWARAATIAGAALTTGALAVSVWLGR